MAGEHVEVPENETERYVAQAIEAMDYYPSGGGSNVAFCT